MVTLHVLKFKNPFMTHTKWMKMALEEAVKAKECEEVPVGALIVYQGECIARAHNLVESRQDPTAHAEILCLQQAAATLGNWRLSKAILYCTLEPCPMCAGAMINARLGELVWGAPDLRQGGDGSFIDLLKPAHPIHNFPITRGICAEESAHLMLEFFKTRRVKT